MTSIASEMKRPVLWTPGDWNAFFGFGTNILVNMLVLTGLLRFVLKMPDSLVFGRILPALGLMMCLSTMYYAFMAYRLALKTGRSDVCALPSGVSVPHMFIVTFVIMLPITLKTNDPIKGWEAGLVWVFFQSFILMIGGFVAPYIRKITPRAALLGTLAGVSVTFISMRPALEMFMTPIIGLTCFAIIMVSSDMEEVIGMSDRVVVMHERRIRGVLARRELTQERIAPEDLGFARAPRETVADPRRQAAGPRSTPPTPSGSRSKIRSGSPT